MSWSCVTRRYTPRYTDMRNDYARVTRITHITPIQRLYMRKKRDDLGPPDASFFTPIYVLNRCATGNGVTPFANSRDCWRKQSFVRYTARYTDYTWEFLDLTASADRVIG